MQPVTITATGYYTPEVYLDNDSLIAHCGLDIDSEWIEQRTGIIGRHWMRDDQTTSDMAVAAARRILKQRGIEIDAIDRIIVATISPDYISPATATIVARKLGARCMAFDISAACAGFLYALDLGVASVRNGAGKVLLLCADARSRFIDKRDRRAAVLFADAAAGALLEPSDRPGVLGMYMAAEGREQMGAFVPAGGAKLPTTLQTVEQGLNYLQVDAKQEIFDLFVHYTRHACDEALKRSNLTLDEIDLFITHQGNARMVELVLDNLGIPESKAVNTVRKHGNVSGASVPLALAESLEQGRIQPGHKVLLTRRRRRLRFWGRGGAVLKELAEYRALVTGAGRGVGRAVALELSRRGARIVAVGRTRENIHQTIAEIEAMGGSGMPLIADICETDWLDQLEPIDIVVHNACAYAPYAQIINSDTDQMRQVFETCVVAPTRISKHVLPGMKKRGFGRIVHVGSVAASLGAHGQAAYCAAKSALVGLTRTIALESSAWGVTCNLVQLGLIETERIAAVVSPAVRERIIGATAVGRIGTVEEAAYIVACLASPRASFVTGAVINASGGLELGIQTGEDSHAD